MFPSFKLLNADYFYSIKHPPMELASSCIEQMAEIANDKTASSIRFR